MGLTGERQNHSNGWNRHSAGTADLCEEPCKVLEPELLGVSAVCVGCWGFLEVMKIFTVSFKFRYGLLSVQRENLAKVFSKALVPFWFNIHFSLQEKILTYVCFFN